MNLVAQSDYGSDNVGLIKGFRFSPDRSGGEIDSTEAAEWLAQPQDDNDDFVWVHLNLARSACERWMRTHLGLPDEFFEALREGSRSTRIEQLESSLLAVVNDVIFNFDLASSDVSTLWICVQPRLVVTARLTPLRSVDKLSAAVKRGEVFRSPLELLVHLLRDQADVLVQIVRQTSLGADRVEDQLLSQHLHDNRANLGAMRRVLVRLQRVLAPEPGALFRLLNRPPAWLDERDVQDLRESTEEFSVVLNDLTALVERIKLLQEEIAAKVNEQTNRTLFTLTIVTVLALPINIVAGLFGMNVGGIPLANHRHGFWVLVLLVATFTALAGWWAFRRQRRF